MAGLSNAIVAGLKEPNGILIYTDVSSQLGEGIIRPGGEPIHVGDYGHGDKPVSPEGVKQTVDIAKYTGNGRAVRIEHIEAFEKRNGLGTDMICVLQADPSIELITAVVPDYKFSHTGKFFASMGFKDSGLRVDEDDSLKVMTWYRPQQS